MIVKIINKSNNPLPKYETPDSAGMDIRAYIEDGSTITLKPGERKLIHTGLQIALPSGYEVQVRSRSGLAMKKGVIVLNSPGTVDADYRGEIGVILYNYGEEDFEIKNGERIAQMVVAKYRMATLQEVEELDETERGEGGFGHTGEK